MRTPEVPVTETGMPKEKKQLLVLGALSLALLGVVSMQFGGDDETVVGGSEAAALDATPVASAATVAQGSAPAPAPAMPLAENPVLAAQSQAPVNDGVFESFWSVASPMEAKVEEVPPPAVTLNATIVAAQDGQSLAVIDGSLRRAGDQIGGWTLHTIGVREISLRSPGDRMVTVNMPVLHVTDPRAVVPSPATATPDQLAGSDA